MYTVSRLHLLVDAGPDRNLFSSLLSLSLSHLMGKTLMESSAFSDSLSNVQHRRRGINWLGVYLTFFFLDNVAMGDNLFLGLGLFLKSLKKQFDFCLLTINQIWEEGQQKIKKFWGEREGEYFVIKEFHGRMRVELGGAQEARNEARR